MLQDQISGVEKQLAVAKATVARGEALARLRNNRDFKSLIEGDYLREEAIRLVHLKSYPDQDTPAKQAGIVQQIDAIGNLARYLDNVRNLADMAAKDIQGAEATLEDLRNGEQE